MGDNKSLITNLFFIFSSNFYQCINLQHGHFFYFYIHFRVFSSPLCNVEYGRTLFRKGKFFLSPNRNRKASTCEEEEKEIFHLSANKLSTFQTHQLIKNPISPSINTLHTLQIHNRFNMSGKVIAAVLAVIAVVAVLIGQAQPNSKPGQFESWMTKFNIKFQSKFEQAYRKRVFHENLAKIEAHNSNEFRTYDMGINQFSALTEEEFKQTYLGTIVPSSDLQVEDSDDISVGDVDWVSQGAVTPIKDQGQCGSCWAFSTTGGLEGLSKLAYGQLQSFSEQQLVDCSGTYGNMGCNGGLMDNAFKYVRDHGIVHESDYGYTAKKGTCKQNSGPFKISGYTDVSGCTNLANALTSRPISVAVDASNWSHYASGVFSNCGTHLNHGVLLVGVSDQYWRIKNSWASGWGQNGFIRLARGNTCGICNKPSYPNK